MIGCFAVSNGAAMGSVAIIKRSGDNDFDFALAQTLGMLSDLFDVRPGFGYYDDTPQNAFATTDALTGHSDGTVAMGLNFLRHLRSSAESPAVAAATVCAHEFGHILQYKHNLMRRVNAGQSNVKRSELQADYFAGYFTGLRKQQRGSYPAASAALTQYDVGDNAFYAADHHGTPKERGAAVVQGFNAGKQGKNLSQVIADSTEYVMSI